MKTRCPVCVVAALIAFASGTAPGGVIFQDGVYHRLDAVYYGHTYVYDNFWSEPTTVELVSGGRIDLHLFAYHHSNVIISGGRISYRLLAHDNSNVTVSGGSIGSWSDGYTLYAYDDSNVTISGGMIAGDLCAYHNSNVAVSGGTVGADLIARANSNVVVSGGLVSGRLRTYDHSNVTVSGGTMGGSIRIFGGTLVVDGQDYVIDGYSLPHGGTFDTGGLAERYGSLTCTLANGEPMANNFTIYDGGSLVLIPEPATMSLLALGGVGVLLRRKK